MDYLKTEERLISAQLGLIDALKTRETLSFDKFNCSLKTAESLSSSTSIDLPLKVKGKILGIGKHKVKYYTEIELKKAVDKYNSLPDPNVPIKLDHEHTKVSSTVGKVDKLIWNATLKIIEYEGHINDMTQALNVRDKAVREVSMTSYSMDVYDPVTGQMIATDIDFGELSLVEEGAFKGNTLEVEA